MIVSEKFEVLIVMFAGLLFALGAAFGTATTFLPEGEMQVYAASAAAICTTASIAITTVWATFMNTLKDKLQIEKMEDLADKLKKAENELEDAEDAKDALKKEVEELTDEVDDLNERVEDIENVLEIAEEQAIEPVKPDCTVESTVENPN